MIEINLLPEGLRRSESTPLAQQVSIYIGVAVWMGLLFLNISYFNQTSQAEQTLRLKKADIIEGQKNEKELKSVNEEIGKIEGHVQAVQDLYRKRLVWAKLLGDLKQIMQKQGYTRANAEEEYLWFNKLSVKEKKTTGSSGSANTQEIILECIASSKSTRRSTLMIERLMAEMKNYRPDLTQKEKESEEIKNRIIEEGKVESEAVVAEVKNEETSESSLDEQLKIRQRKAAKKLLEHLELKSGGIAIKPFWENFQDLNYKQEWLESMSFGDAAKKLTMVPLQAMKFTVNMGLKPAEAPQTKSRIGAKR